MPAFGLPQSGPNPISGLNVTCLQPSEELTLFDGTETPVLNLASIAFARGFQGSVDGGSTFNLSGMPSGMTIDVQVCSPPSGGFTTVAAMAAAFNSVVTISPDANGNGSYTDIGRSALYRLLILAYTSGAMPVGVVQR